MSVRVLSRKSAGRVPAAKAVHTQGAGAIPQDNSTLEAKKTREGAVAAAAGLLSRLVEALKRIIAATSKVILDRQSKKR
jgi:hypothetical protein